jgi:pilus assembly protein CpaC
MTVLARIRAALMTVAVATAALAAAPAAAQSYLQLSETDVQHGRPIALGVNKSMVIELPRAAGDVLVSNPGIADAVLRTSRRLYLIGVKVGQANVFLFDAAGAQLASFEVYVEADLSSLNQLLAEAITDGYVRAEAINGNVVLRGQVASAADSSRAQEIVTGMLQGGSEGSAPAADGASGSTVERRVVNLLTITGEEQVSLKVTIAEVQREVVKQLGINLSGTGSSGNFDFSGSNPFQFPINTSASPGTLGVTWSTGAGSITATLKALEDANVIRTLAEPTLTAVSGETANFLAGGEFPVVTSVSDNGVPSVTFKEFGVKLAFTPVVLSPGRISLHVATEVSALSTANSVSFGGFTIPGTTSRKAESTVELPSGGAFVLAGLISEETRRSAGGFPVLQNIPILGALFSSKDFLNRQTELVMIVTPYLVKPVSPAALARPDENLMMSNDAEAYFRGRLTKMYGTAGHAPANAGRVGFAFD